MTDKEKIRAEIERLRKYYQGIYEKLDSNDELSLISVCAKRNILLDILLFIDSLEEKPKFNIGDVVLSTNYVELKIVDIRNKCYYCDNGYSFGFDIQDEFELVKEPKKCLFTQDHYTEEDRKVLCADCDEKDCELRSKPIKLREQKGVLGNMLDKLDDKEIEKVRQEMIKESGDELAMEIESLSKRYPEVSYAKLSRIAVHIAKWQRKQIIDKACEWLDGAIPDYIELKRANVDTFINIDNKKFVEDFCKAMED